jgi:hypothetical protein
LPVLLRVRRRPAGPEPVFQQRVQLARRPVQVPVREQLVAESERPRELLPWSAQAAELPELFRAWRLVARAEVS